MKSYLYILGRTPDLSFLELKTFLPDITRILPDVAASDSLVDIDKLGGTIKIAKVTDVPVVEAKSTFGVSVYGGPQLSTKELEAMKKEYGASRFIATRGEPLSSVVIAKNKAQEILLIKDKHIVAQTIAVQPFEKWSSRDLKRQFVDARSGMLPPKVARMAVNCAGTGVGKTLLDPFCGMGTILSEAQYMGWHCIGSDVSQDVVEKARENLSGTPVTVYTSDATHISEQLQPHSVDAVVTEPFMGDARSHANAGNIIKGLEKLYIGCLKDWSKILTENGVVVMALPSYALNGRTFFVKKVIDMCEKLGYTIQAGPIEYGRPGAIVKREFYIFQNHGTR